MKIIVKLQLEPEIKEVFTGNNLEVLKVDRTLRIQEGKRVLAEFDQYLYWVKEGFKDEIKDALAERELLLKEIQKIARTDFKELATAVQRLKKIQKMISERPVLSEIILLEPNEAALLLNLGYLDSFVEKLGPGMPEETLRWAIYAVKQYVENDMVPGGPCDPNSADWSWEQFKNSFRKTSESEEA